MEMILRYLGEYCNKLKNRKKYILTAAVMTIALFVLSSCFLYTGINKRFVLYTFLCIGCGLFIALPRVEKWYFNSVLLVGYLLVVPKKIFERIELPVHNMERIQPGIPLGSICIILLVYVLCLLLFQRVRYALGIGNILLLAAFLINYYVVEFRGTALSFNDIMAVRTAAQVVDNYQFSVGAEQWYSVLYFLFFILLGFWCDLPGKGLKYHAAVCVTAFVGLFGFYYFWNVSDYFAFYGLRGNYWNVADNHHVNGFLMSFGISIREGKMEKPEGYSEKALKEIAENAEREYAAEIENTGVKPDIIFIMNEAWSDLSVLGPLETSEPYMPFVDSLEGNVVKGNVYVNIIGGLTANSEFEALTGDSLTFLSSSAIPYQLQVNHDMYALPRILKEQGYATMAMHPSVETAWNRDDAYDYFGFDEFVDINDFQTEYEHLRTFISDACNFGEIIWQYEHRDTSKPWFLFDVTIQNHGDYYGGIDMPIKITKVGNNGGQGYLYDAETYLNLVKITDDAFKELIGYFEKVDTPTIICMFGDHQPSLGDDFYDSIFAESGLSAEEQSGRKFITPYVIWTNYDVDLKEYGDLSVNYMGAALMESAGLELPPYYKFLMNLQKKYPVISGATINQIRDEEEIKKYKMLQYNQLIDRNAYKELYSGNF